MASRASGWGRYTARPVRAMAAETAGCELSVCGVGFRRVTRDALHLLAGARMRLMAARAGLVSARRTGCFSLMTALAWRRCRAAVRVVAADAVLVTGVCFSMRGCVAGRAGSVTGAGIVRQPAVASLASSVTRPHGGQRDLFLVTVLAGCVLRERDLEVVRRMTVLARRPVVKGAVGRGLLMTAAAGPCERGRLGTGGVSVVTAQAAPEAGPFRVVRMNVPVAALARRRGALFDVVRLVAARADRVGRHLRLREHDHARVTRTTRNGLFCRKLMRAVAAHAGRVSTGK